MRILLTSCCLIGLLLSQTHTDAKILFVSEDPLTDRRFLYVMDDDGGNVTLLSHQDFAGTPRWSPDGKQIAFASWRGGIWDIYTIDPDGKGETNLTNSKSNDKHPTWSPDGTQIAYSSQRGGLYGIYVMNADGSDSVALVEDLKVAIQPAWAPASLAVSPTGKLSTLWGTLKREK